MTRDEIFSTLVETLSESFELDPSEIKRESQLYEELGLDSIDAVDIFVQLREVTGRRPDPAVAREIRTVDELITFVENELAAKAAGLSRTGAIGGGHAPRPWRRCRTGRQESGRRQLSSEQVERSTVDLNWVLDRMPHQPPMRLLDRVLSADESSIVCGVTIGEDHWLLDERREVSPAIAIELFAQAAAGVDGLSILRARR